MSGHVFKNLSSALERPLEVHCLHLSLKKEDKISHDIYKFTNIEELYIQGENLWDLDIKTLLKLRYLSASCPKLSEISPTIFELPSIETLNLKNCGIKSLPEMTRPNVTLKNLYLNNNFLTKIGPSFAMLKSLTTLFLSGNNLEELSTDLAQLKHLSRLTLDHNKLTRLPDFIKDLPKLKHISLDGNPFSEEERSRIMAILPIWF